MTLPIALARRTASRVALRDGSAVRLTEPKWTNLGALQGAVGDIAGGELDVGVRFAVKA